MLLVIQKHDLIMLVNVGIPVDLHPLNIHIIITLDIFVQGDISFSKTHNVRIWKTRIHITPF